MKKLRGTGTLPAQAYTSVASIERACTSTCKPRGTAASRRWIARLRTAMDYDVIIIGGSYAGLSAALQLARARRNVLIVDADQRRNRFANVSHGFITHDGEPGATIIEQARREVAAYPTVEWKRGTVQKAEALNGKAFAIRLESGATYSSLRLILAYGVIDD